MSNISNPQYEELGEEFISLLGKSDSVAFDDFLEKKKFSKKKWLDFLNCYYEVDGEAGNYTKPIRLLVESGLFPRLLLHLEKQHEQAVTKEDCLEQENALLMELSKVKGGLTAISESLHRQNKGKSAYFHKLDLCDLWKPASHVLTSCIKNGTVDEFKFLVHPADKISVADQNFYNDIFIKCLKHNQIKDLDELYEKGIDLEVDLTRGIIKSAFEENVLDKAFLFYLEKGGDSKRFLDNLPRNIWCSLMKEGAERNLDSFFKVVWGNDYQASAWNYIRDEHHVVDTPSYSDASKKANIRFFTEVAEERKNSSLKSHSSLLELFIEQKQISQMIRTLGPDPAELTPYLEKRSDGSTFLHVFFSKSIIGSLEAFWESMPKGEIEKIISNTDIKNKDGDTFVDCLQGVGFGGKGSLPFQIGHWGTEEGLQQLDKLWQLYCDKGYDERLSITIKPQQDEKEEINLEGEEAFQYVQWEAYQKMEQEKANPKKPTGFASSESISQQSSIQKKDSKIKD